MDNHQFLEQFLQEFTEVAEQEGRIVGSGPEWHMGNDKHLALQYIEGFEKVSIQFRLQGLAIRSRLDPWTREYAQVLRGDESQQIAAEYAYKEGMNDDLQGYIGIFDNIFQKFVQNKDYRLWFFLYPSFWCEKRLFNIEVMTAPQAIGVDRKNHFDFERLNELRDILLPRKVTYREFLQNIENRRKRWQMETEEILFENPRLFNEDGDVFYDDKFISDVVNNWGEWPFSSKDCSYFPQTMYFFNKTSIGFRSQDALFRSQDTLSVFIVGEKKGITTRIHFFDLDIHRFIDEGIAYLLGEGMRTRFYSGYIERPIRIDNPSHSLIQQQKTMQQQNMFRDRNVSRMPEGEEEFEEEFEEDIEEEQELFYSLSLDIRLIDYEASREEGFLIFSPFINWIEEHRDYLAEMSKILLPDVDYQFTVIEETLYRSIAPTQRIWSAEEFDYEPEDLLVDFPRFFIEHYEGKMNEYQLNLLQNKLGRFVKFLFDTDCRYNLEKWGYIPFEIKRGSEILHFRLFGFELKTFSEDGSCLEESHYRPFTYEQQKAARIECEEEIARRVKDSKWREKTEDALFENPLQLRRLSNRRRR